FGCEIGRERAKVLLGKAFGEGSHDRVLALAVAVIAHLFEQVGPLLPPDDRDGFRVGGHAVLAVTGRAELRRRLDGGGMRRQRNERETNPGAEKRRRQTCAHDLTPSLPANGARFCLSIQRWKPQSNPGRQRRPRMPANKLRRRAGMALCHPTTRVTMPASRLPMESNQ